MAFFRVGTRQEHREYKKNRDFRIRHLGCRCEICGKKIKRKFLHAHHVWGTEFNHWKELMLRCRECEVQLHVLSPHGNTRRSFEIQANNNECIEWSIRFGRMLRKGRDREYIQTALGRRPQEGRLAVRFVA